MPLDKTYFRKQTFEQAADHRADYLSMNEAERSEAFFILMQAAFGFVGESWPRMEKAVYTKSKRNISEED